MRAVNQIYHVRCFVCVVCGRQLNKGDQFVLSSDSLIYCRLHYEHRCHAFIPLSPNSNDWFNVSCKCNTSRHHCLFIYLFIYYQTRTCSIQIKTMMMMMMIIIIIIIIMITMMMMIIIIIIKKSKNNNKQVEVQDATLPGALLFPGSVLDSTWDDRCADLTRAADRLRSINAQLK